MKVGFWNFYQVFSYICLHASFLTDSFNKTLILKWDVNNKDINETLWQVAIGIEPVIVVDIKVCGTFLYGETGFVAVSLSSIARKFRKALLTLSPLKSNQNCQDYMWKKFYA